MRRPLEPGEIIGLGLVAVGLTASAVLVALGHNPISTCTRRSRLGRSVAIGLAAHVCVHSDRDPLSWVGRQIARGVEKRRNPLIVVDIGAVTVQQP